MPYAVVRELTIERDGEIRIEGLPVRQGQRVQIFVIKRTEIAADTSRYPLQGEDIRYDNPFAPAASPEDWEANR